MMMQDIAMHILDIGMNSIAANSHHIQIALCQKENALWLQIHDDGCGMSEETVKQVTDPFYTTRSTRSIGLGIPFLKAAAQLCEGTFELSSKVQEGTSITAIFRLNHWDCPPLGDLGEAVVNLAVFDESIRFTLSYRNETDQFVFDTDRIKEELEGVALSEPSIMVWMKQFINEQISCLTKGGDGRL